MTPLHVVARRGRITTVDCLIDKGADINIKDNNEVNIYTGLCYYSKSVLTICVSSHLRKGALSLLYITHLFIV